MDSTIKRILGETEEFEQPPETQTDEKGAGVDDSGHAGPDDAEIDELANLWTTGNKGEVMRRFMDMDNEKSVKLVFAIGREGSLEMARMVDQAMEQNEGPEETTEPVRVERPEPPENEPTDHVREIIGRPHVMPQ